MPGTLDTQLGEALLKFVRSDAYPETEEIISAKLPSSALPVVVDVLHQARQDIKEAIRVESRDVLPNVENWIAGARQLNDDVKRSEAAARDIAGLEAERQSLEDQVHDLEAKQGLLRNEIAFSDALFQCLLSIKDLKHDLDLAEENLRANDSPAAIEALGRVETRLLTVKGWENTAVLSLLGAHAAELRRVTIERAEASWDALFTVDSDKRLFSVKQTINGKQSSEIQGLVVDSLATLGILPSKTGTLAQDLHQTIFYPLLSQNPQAARTTVVISDESVSLQESDDPLSLTRLLEDLTEIIRHLDSHLPRSVTALLSRRLIPPVVSTLITSWLSTMLPLSLEGLGEFERVLEKAASFRDFVGSIKWQGMDELTEWLDDVPQAWLHKRREECLKTTRSFMLQGAGQLRSVHRAETQRLSATDGTAVAAGKGQVEKPAFITSGDGVASSTTHETKETDETDMSAWGFDDAPNERVEEDGHEAANDADDAWGFEDNNDASVPSEEPTTAGNSREKQHEEEPQKAPSEREVTLTETYSISHGPDAVLKVIDHIIRDSITLHRSTSEYKSVAAAATDLFSSSGLVLAMYRALSPHYYKNFECGNMLLYNDCLWLGERLRQLGAELPDVAGRRHPWADEKAKYNAGIKQLEAYGNAAYKREMESQRSALRDILGRAQSFENCSIEPYASRCEEAVNELVDRITGLHRQWKGVLSHSALLQSLGSLLSTVVSAIILDIGDMSDISEVESQQLARFCNHVAKLEDLFRPDGDGQQRPAAAAAATAAATGSAGAGAGASSAGGQEPPVALTPIYTPNWFRFQFLVSILESSLADIRYLWEEGELRLEFTVDEVVDLIQALFADSDLRRRTVADIKRSSRSG